MRIGGLLALVIVALTAMPPRADAQASRVKSDQDILIELEHNWDAAFRRHDAAFIATILLEKFGQLIRVMSAREGFASLHGIARFVPITGEIPSAKGWFSTKVIATSPE